MAWRGLNLNLSVIFLKQMLNDWYHSRAVIWPSYQKLLSGANCHAFDHTDLPANFPQVAMCLRVKDLNILAVCSCITYIQGEYSYLIHLPFIPMLLWNLALMFCLLTPTGCIMWSSTCILFQVCYSFIYFFSSIFIIFLKYFIFQYWNVLRY